MLEAEKAADTVSAQVQQLWAENRALTEKVEDANKAFDLFREFQRLVEAGDVA